MFSSNLIKCATVEQFGQVQLTLYKLGYSWRTGENKAPLYLEHFSTTGDTCIILDKGRTTFGKAQHDKQTTGRVLDLTKF